MRKASKVACTPGELHMPACMLPLIFLVHVCSCMYIAMLAYQCSAYYMQQTQCSRVLVSRELAELQKANAVTQSAAHEAALTAEQSAREQLKSILDQQKLGAQREKEALLMQVRKEQLQVYVKQTCYSAP